MTQGDYVIQQLKAECDKLTDTQLEKIVLHILGKSYSRDFMGSRLEYWISQAINEIIKRDIKDWLQEYMLEKIWETIQAKLTEEIVVEISEAITDQFIKAAKNGDWHN